MCLLLLRARGGVDVEHCGEDCSVEVMGRAALIGDHANGSGDGAGIVLPQQNAYISRVYSKLLPYPVLDDGDEVGFEFRARIWKYAWRVEVQGQKDLLIGWHQGRRRRRCRRKAGWEHCGDRGGALAWAGSWDQRRTWRCRHRGWRRCRCQSRGRGRGWGRGRGGSFGRYSRRWRSRWASGVWHPGVSCTGSSVHAEPIKDQKRGAQANGLLGPFCSSTMAAVCNHTQGTKEGLAVTRCGGCSCALG